MTGMSDLEERVARAIWEVNHPNPPGWAAWGDHTGWGPDAREREWTLKKARAAIEACGGAESAAAEAIRARCAAIARAHQERCEKLRDRQNALGRPAIEAQEQAYAAEEIAEAIEALTESEDRNEQDA